MKPMQWLARAATLTSGNGIEWMREELRTLGVRVPVTDGCLRDLVANADLAARAQLGDAYIPLLREQIVRRAEFVKSWTQSNETRFDARLVGIAHNHALPRAWKLTELHSVPARRPTPIYMKWASATPASPA